MLKGALGAVFLLAGGEAAATVTAVSAGGSHSCALTSVGGVSCWGDNWYGQLGDGTTTNRWTPTAVPGLSSGVVALSAGGSHTCALTTAGGVLCWGRNSYSQLGDGTTTNRWTPTAVSGLSSGVAAISAGNYHTCALTTAGGVLCWGANNYYGQLGDGTTTNRWTPTAVSGLSSGVTALSAGAYYTCALTTAGGVLCWGYNYYGQLGDGTTTTRQTPTAVSGLSSGVAALSAGGSHTCALTTAGGVQCWGSNSYGQLGDGTTTNRTAPVAVSGLASGMTAITAGGEFTCALEAGVASYWCWGRNNYAQLGDGTTADHSAPVGSAAPVDTDSDGWWDALDNCPLAVNAGQEDTDGDGEGDACNDVSDGDGDEWSNALDNCPLVSNPGQEDNDGDGIGNTCTVLHPINWEGEAGLELARLGEESSPWLAGGGIAGVGVAGGSFPGHLGALRIQEKNRGGIWGTATVLVTDPALSGAGVASAALSNAEVGTATLSPISGGVGTGVLVERELPLRGLLKLCFVDPACSGGELSFSLTTASSAATPTLQGVGIGGTVSGTAQSFTGTTPPVLYTLEAAPWTLKTATVDDQTGVTGTGTAAQPLLASATAQGFAHGPASATSSTADVNGVVSFVSPVQIQTTLDPSDPRHLSVLGATARLTIRFVPEPAALVGLAAALAGLAAFSRRRRRA